MLNLKRTLVILAILTTLPFAQLRAQEDGDAVKTYSPYTLYGIGDMSRMGGARNKGMGGLNYGVRDQASINSYNPAALSIQDSLVVMLDFGIGSKNTYSKTTNEKTSANSLYFDYVDFSFRVANGLTFDIGLSPISDIGYNIERRETDANIINQVGDVKYRYVGEGGVNQLHWGAGYKIFRNFSVGVNMHYYFGSINRTYTTDFETNTSYASINTMNKTRISKIGFTFGAQMHTRLNKNTFLTIGAIYQPKTKLPSKKETTTVVTGDIATDTVRADVAHLQDVFMPQTIGAGFTIRHTDKWLFGLDYTYQDWTDFNLDGNSQSFTFEAGKSHTYNLGIEYTPRANNIKNNLKRWNYRAGFRYSDTFMKCNGQKIKEYGIVFGVGVPLVKRGLGSKINFSVEYGKRGTLKHDLVKEDYVTLSLGINIFDTWFHKFLFN